MTSRTSRTVCLYLFVFRLYACLLLDFILNDKLREKTYKIKMRFVKSFVCFIQQQKYIKSNCCEFHINLC